MEKAHTMQEKDDLYKQGDGGFLRKKERKNKQTNKHTLRFWKLKESHGRSYKDSAANAGDSRDVEFNSG